MFDLNMLIYLKVVGKPYTLDRIILADYDDSVGLEYERDPTFRFKNNDVEFRYGNILCCYNVHSWGFINGKIANNYIAEHAVKRKFILSSYCASGFVWLLKTSDAYRLAVMNHWSRTLELRSQNKSCMFMIIESVMPNTQIIDYRWNYKMLSLWYERCELDTMMAWFSTLGGGFSCLGDTITHCAEIAGKISIKQYKIAKKLQDPHMIIRCRLYFAISLIQRSHLKKARVLLLNEYKKIISEGQCNNQLKRSCEGIWEKLRYTWKMKRKMKKLNFGS